MTEKDAADDKHVVLGIGTGRSGSETLAYLLNLQHDSCFSHEFGLFSSRGERAPRYRPPLGWHASKEDASRSFLGLRQYPAHHVGDIGSYWLPHLPDICQQYPSLRVVCIVRDKEAVVRSFMKKTEGRNHWINHDRTNWRLDPLWDPVFPTYDLSDKAEAIGAYWEDYRKDSERLREQFPDSVKIWPLAALNKLSTAHDILAHCGMSEQKFIIPKSLRRNRSKHSLLKRFFSKKS